MADAQNLPQPSLPSDQTPLPSQAPSTSVEPSAGPISPQSQPNAASPATVPAPAAPPAPPLSPTPMPAAQPVASSSTPSPTAAQPEVSSRLLQNLQSVSAAPFQDMSAPQNASQSPMPPSDAGATAPAGAVSNDVPQENIGFSSAPAAAAGGSDGGGNTPPQMKAARTGGFLDSLRQNRLFLFGGIGALVVLLIAGGVFAYTQFLAPQPTSVVTDSSTAPANTRTTTLTYWGLWEPEEVMQPLIDAYEAENPGITINYVQQRSDQYRQRVQTAIRDGSGPDIFRYHNTWMPMVRDDLAPAPNSVITGEYISQNFYPIMERDLVINDSVYGVPLMYEGLVLLYNQNMFQSAGVQPPQDWNQVRSAASQLTIRDGDRIQRAGIALGTAENVDHFSDILGLMMLQNSANPADPTSDNVRDAVSFYTVFSAQDGVWDDTFPNSVSAFANEQVAMIFAPSWRIFEIQRANPNLSIGAVRTPQLGGTTVTWGTYWVEGVSEASRNKQEAWKFLAYLAEEEQLRDFHDAGAAYRAFGELYPRVEMAEALTTNPLIQPYLEDALYARSWFMASMTHDEGLNDQMIQYYTDAINASNTGSGNVERALQQIAPGVQQVLSRYAIPAPAPATTQ